jgi:hypothetical protein
MQFALIKKEHFLVTISMYSSITLKQVKPKEQQFPLSKGKFLDIEVFTAKLYYPH